MMFKTHIRHASDETLRAIKLFFDTPDLRRYYLGLLEDVEAELILRGQEDEHGEPEPEPEPAGVDRIGRRRHRAAGTKRGRRARASER